VGQPLNWSTGDKPIDGDNVDLASNWVNFGGSVTGSTIFSWATMAD
jgi:hypothetical protein